MSNSCIVVGQCFVVVIFDLWSNGEGERRRGTHNSTNVRDVRVWGVLHRREGSGELGWWDGTEGRKGRKKEERGKGRRGRREGRREEGEGRRSIPWWVLSSSQEGTPSLHLRPPVPSLDDNTPPPVEQEGGVNEVALLERYPIYQGRGQSIRGRGQSIRREGSTIRGRGQSRQHASAKFHWRPWSCEHSQWRPWCHPLIQEVVASPTVAPALAPERGEQRRVEGKVMGSWAQETLIPWKHSSLSHSHKVAEQHQHLLWHVLCGWVGKLLLHVLKRACGRIGGDLGDRPGSGW